MSIQKFIKKPVEIEAILWTGENLFEVTSFIDGKAPELNCDAARGAWENYGALVRLNGLNVRTLEGTMKANVGDYIFKGENGGFYPCEADVFVDQYALLHDPKENPQPCDTEVHTSGRLIGMYDIPKWTAEEICRAMSSATGWRIDWHYFCGRVVVKALPPKENETE